MSKLLLTNMIAGAIVCLIVLPALATPDNARASESDAATGYILNIDEDGPGADALSRGDFATAAVQATPYAQNHASLSAFLTLCAANISLGALDQAHSACNSAVELAEKPLTTERNPHGHANREGLAKAHSNRGVLRALSGDLSGARAEFEQAKRQRRYPDVIRHNLGLTTSAIVAATPN